MRNDHRHRRCIRRLSLRGSLLLLFPLSFLLLTSCYTNRYIPDGGHRLDETVQTVVMADSSEVPPEVRDALKNSENYYLQRRNSKVFGIRWLPVGMWIYSIASPSDSSFWGNYWRRLGQAPVVYEEDKARRTARQLQGLLESKGCFHSTVTFDTLEMEGKKIAIGYHLTATHRYLVEEVIYHTQNDTIRGLIDKWQPSSPLKAGTYYDQEIMAAERSRLVSLLREEGYYHAAVDNITFLVDTTYNDRRLSVDVFNNHFCLFIIRHSAVFQLVISRFIRLYRVYTEDISTYIILINFFQRGLDAFYRCARFICHRTFQDIVGMRSSILYRRRTIFIRFIE